jgi:hypothetical protein
MLNAPELVFLTANVPSGTSEKFVGEQLTQPEQTLAKDRRSAEKDPVLTFSSSEASLSAPPEHTN